MIDESRKAREARLEALRTLKPCHGLMQHPRHELPIPIVVTPHSLPSLSAEDLEALMEPFWRAHPPIPVIPEEPKKEDALKPEHRRFLALIEVKPLKPTTFYYRSLGLSLSAGDRIRKQLISKGLIRIHPVRTYRRGGTPEIIELLPPAYELLGMPHPSPSVKGGVVHRFWAQQIAEHLRRKGLQPSFEVSLNGKAVDVGVSASSGITAYEVQLDARTDLVKDMVEKDLGAGFQKVIVCVPSPDDAKKVQATVAALGSAVDEVKDKVEVRLLAEFYQSPKEESQGL